MGVEGGGRSEQRSEGERKEEGRKKEGERKERIKGENTLV